MSLIEKVSELPRAPEIPWALRPYLAYGCITDLTGPAKAAGKSTFVQHMVRAILTGQEFLGEQADPGPVLYLTEEHTTAFRASLSRLDLDRKGLPFYALRWHRVWSLDWTQIAGIADKGLKECGARVLIIDTFPQFAPDAERDAQSGLAALRPLQRLAALDIAILIVRHERKGGGAVGKSSRGTSAIGGAVDIMLKLSRRSKNSNKRTLTALSRFSEDTPEESHLVLTDNQYTLIKEETDKVIRIKR